MHIGGVRTALFAYLWALKNSGTFILRIEDTDKKREIAGSIEHIEESLKWLRIIPNYGPKKPGPFGSCIQSERLESYHEYAQKLIEKGLAYADPFTEEEVERFRADAVLRKQSFLFRNYRPDVLPTVWKKGIALRFKVPVIKRYSWNDVVRGQLEAGEEALDDFILIKADGYPTYNFAHVVDDHLMGITHIFRADEFISSTPRFLSLYEALEIERPLFVTLPPILGPDKTKKLGKRDGARDILEYRKDGYLPEAMVNFLALLGWNPGTEQEFFSIDELVHAFDIDRIQVSGASFDEVKLRSINQHWMRELSDKAFIELGNLSAPDETKLRKAVAIMKERARTFAEARAMLTDGELSCLFSEPSPSKDRLLAKELPERPGIAKTALKSLLEAIKGLPEAVSPDAVKEALMPLANEEEAKGKGGRGAVLWPLRYALSGADRSPDPFTLISVLGKEDAVSRVQKAIAILEG